MNLEKLPVWWLDTTELLYLLKLSSVSPTQRGLVAYCLGHIHHDGGRLRIGATEGFRFPNTNLD